MQNEGAVDHRRRAMGHRPARALAAVAGTLLLAACASAESTIYPHGEQSDTWTDGSVVRTVLVFIVAPLAITALVAALVLLPGLRGARYRPQFGWSAPPVWFAGPEDPVAAVESAQTGDVRRGGAGGSW